MICVLRNTVCVVRVLFGETSSSSSVFVYRKKKGARSESECFDVCWARLMHETDFVGRKCRSTSIARRGLRLCVLKVARSYTSFTRRSPGTCPCAPLSLPAPHPLSSLADTPFARLYSICCEREFVCRLLQRSRQWPLRNQARGSRHSHCTIITALY